MSSLFPYPASPTAGAHSLDGWKGRPRGKKLPSVPQLPTPLPKAPQFGSSVPSSLPFGNDVPQVDTPVFGSPGIPATNVGATAAAFKPQVAPASPSPRSFMAPGAGFQQNDVLEAIMARLGY